jgi:hypothetical protein
LSMEDPSTIRRADELAAIDLAPYEGIRDRDKRQQRTADEPMYPICSVFAICSFENLGAGPVSNCFGLV